MAMLSALAVDHVRRRRNEGPLLGATRYGVHGVPGDGPWVEIWLVLIDARITDAGYRTHGCPASVASASLLCELIKGRTVEEASRVTGEDLLVVLGGLPEGKEEFAHGAANALRKALGEDGGIC